MLYSIVIFSSVKTSLCMCHNPSVFLCPVSESWHHPLFLPTERVFLFQRAGRHDKDQNSHWPVPDLWPLAEGCVSGATKNKPEPVSLWHDFIKSLNNNDLMFPVTKQKNHIILSCAFNFVFLYCVGVLFWSVWVNTEKMKLKYNTIPSGIFWSFPSASHHHDPEWLQQSSDRFLWDPPEKHITHNTYCMINKE